MQSICRGRWLTRISFIIGILTAFSPDKLLMPCELSGFARSVSPVSLDEITFHKGLAKGDRQALYFPYLIVLRFANW